jgi:hypothetical protein
MPGAFKADLFRLAFLYHEGGVYADIDALPFQPLTSILPEEATFVGVVERPAADGGLYNCFIASVKGSPFLYNAMEKIVDNVMNQNYFVDALVPPGKRNGRPIGLFTISGPLMLGSLVNEIIGANWLAPVPTGLVQMGKEVAYFIKPVEVSPTETHLRDSRNVSLIRAEVHAAIDDEAEDGQTSRQMALRKSAGKSGHVGEFRSYVRMFCEREVYSCTSFSEAACCQWGGNEGCIQQHLERNPPAGACPHQNFIANVTRPSPSNTSSPPAALANETWEFAIGKHVGVPLYCAVLKAAGGARSCNKTSDICETCRSTPYVPAFCASEAWPDLPDEKKMLRAGEEHAAAHRPPHERLFCVERGVEAGLSILESHTSELEVMFHVDHKNNNRCRRTLEFTDTRADSSAFTELRATNSFTGKAIGAMKFCIPVHDFNSSEHTMDGINRFAHFLDNEPYGGVRWEAGLTTVSSAPARLANGSACLAQIPTERHKRKVPPSCHCALLDEIQQWPDFTDSNLGTVECISLPGGVDTIDYHTISAYKKIGAHAVQRLSDAIRGESGPILTPPPMEDLHEGRIGLLTFPNTGTSETLQLAQCLAGHGMCTSYCKEVRLDPNNRSMNCCTNPEACQSCGDGSFGFRLPFDKNASHAKRSLTKSHGIAYGEKASAFSALQALPVNHLKDALDVQLGVCNASEGMDGFLTLERNTFDTLVSRYHLLCDNGHESCIGRSAEGFLSYDGMALPQFETDDDTPADLCLMLQWHHRARLVRQSCPSQVVSYEEMVLNTTEYLGNLYSLIEPSSAFNPECGASIRRRNASLIEAGLPANLTMFDADSIIRVSRGIERYLELSNNLTSEKIVPCSGLPGGRTSSSMRRLQRSACSRCLGCCNVWPGTLEQWLQARLDLSREGFVATSKATLRDFLSVPVVTKDKRWPHVGRDGTTSGGFYFVDVQGHETLLSYPTCVASFNGKLLVYERVYKSASQGICANLRKLHDDSLPLPCNSSSHLQGDCTYHEVSLACTADPSKCLVFTFVRNPLDRLVSSFSELSWRVDQESSNKGTVSSLYTFNQHKDPVTRAHKFIEDLIGGRLGRRSRDAHAFSQVGFLTRTHRELPPIPARRFIGKLETIHEDWFRLGKLLMERGAPKPDQHFPHFKNITGHHENTNAASGNTDREGMMLVLSNETDFETELPNSTEMFALEADSVHPESNVSVITHRSFLPWKVAACRILLPDYVCFGYPLPDDCAEAIGDHDVTCPKVILERPKDFAFDAEIDFSGDTTTDRNEVPHPMHSKPVNAYDVAPACFGNLSTFAALPAVDMRNFTVDQLASNPQLADAGVCVVDKRVHRGQRTCLPSLILIGTGRGGTGEFLNYAQKQPRLSCLGKVTEEEYVHGEGHFFGRRRDLPITLMRKRNSTMNGTKVNRWLVNHTEHNRSAQNRTRLNETERFYRRLERRMERNNRSKGAVVSSIAEADLVIRGDEIFGYDALIGEDLVSVNQHALVHYLQEFPAGVDTWTFEKTPGYMDHGEEAILQIKAFLPSARILVLLREPTARAYSAFSLKKERGRKVGIENGEESLSTNLAAQRECPPGNEHACDFDTAVDTSLTSPDAKGSIRFLLDQGLYSERLEQLSTYFSCGQVFIGMSEALYSSPADFTNRIWEQLGLPQVVYDDMVFRSKVDVASLNHQTPMLDSTRARLHTFYDPDIRKLKAMVPGLDYSVWDPPTPASIKAAAEKAKADKEAAERAKVEKLKAEKAAERAAAAAEKRAAAAEREKAAVEEQSGSQKDSNASNLDMGSAAETAVTSKAPSSSPTQPATDASEAPVMPPPSTVSTPKRSHKRPLLNVTAGRGRSSATKAPEKEQKEVLQAKPLKEARPRVIVPGVVNATAGRSSATKAQDKASKHDAYTQASAETSVAPNTTGAAAKVANADEEATSYEAPTSSNKSEAATGTHASAGEQKAASTETATSEHAAPQNVTIARNRAPKQSHTASPEVHRATSDHGARSSRRSPDAEASPSPALSTGASPSPALSTPSSSPRTSSKPSSKASPKPSPTAPTLSHSLTKSSSKASPKPSPIAPTLSDSSPIPAEDFTTSPSPPPYPPNDVAPPPPSSGREIDDSVAQTLARLRWDEDEEPIDENRARHEERIKALKAELEAARELRRQLDARSDLVRVETAEPSSSPIRDFARHEDKLKALQAQLEMANEAAAKALGTSPP